MNDIKKQKQYAAQLARKICAGEINYMQFLDEFPNDSNDTEIIELLDLIEHTPKQGGLFGVSKEDYSKYISTVYELIEKLEK